MQVIPAIDLKQGRCVRLKQGRMEDETIFSDDPVAMAQHWQALGAARLHVVDLDGAVGGGPGQLQDHRGHLPGFKHPGAAGAAGCAICPELPGLWTWA